MQCAVQAEQGAARAGLTVKQRSRRPIQS